MSDPLHYFNSDVTITEPYCGAKSWNLRLTNNVKVVTCVACLELMNNPPVLIHWAPFMNPHDLMNNPTVTYNPKDVTCPTCLEHRSLYPSKKVSHG